MWGILTKVGALVRTAIGFIFPVFAAARTHRGLRSGLLWLIHVLLVVAITVGLFFLNPYVEYLLPLGRNIRKVWLPVLFLFLYALGWQAYWIYRLLTEDEPASRFLDIDEAWKEAKQALDQAGIDLTAVPLFLVLGRPAGPESVQTEEGLFKACRLPFAVKGVPQRPTAPLHVYGGDEGVFVTCAGASLLGKFALNLATKAGPAGPAANAVNWNDMSMRIQGTLLPGQIQAMLAASMHGGGGPGATIGGGLGQSLVAGGQQMPAAGRPIQTPTGSRTPRLNAVANLNQWPDRLGHLCWLIARDRQPFCPINGILVLLPFAGADNDEAAEDTATACRRDLETAQAALKIHCPRLALLCDLETITGFREFVGRFTEEQRRQPLGKGFPLMPEVAESADAPSLMDSYTEWICGRVFPDWIYRFFRLEAPGKLELDAAIENNKNLFHLNCQMVERQKRLSRILKVGLFERKGPTLFGGCYVAGTGRDPLQQQAFVDGVFRRLVKYQEYVMWTDQALREDADQWRGVRRGYATLATLSALALALIGYLLFRK